MLSETKIDKECLICYHNFTIEVHFVKSILLYVLGCQAAGERDKCRSPCRGKHRAGSGDKIRTAVAAMRSAISIRKNYVLQCWKVARVGYLFLLERIIDYEKHHFYRRSHRYDHTL